jgi:hypothetical protein
MGCGDPVSTKPQQLRYRLDALQLRLTAQSNFTRPDCSTCEMNGERPGDVDNAFLHVYKLKACWHC